MKLSLAALALMASAALAAPAAEAKKGVDPSLCTFSEQEYYQEAACAGEWWAKIKVMKCGLKVKCSGDFSSTFGISDKARRSPEPQRGSDPSIGCDNLKQNLEALVDWMWSQYQKYGLVPSQSALEALAQTFQQAITLCGGMVSGGELIPSPTIPGGPMLPDRPNPGGPIVPDRGSSGGPIVPDRGNPGGPIKPST